MIVTGESRSPRVTLPTTNLTWTELGFRLCLRGWALSPQPSEPWQDTTCVWTLRVLVRVWCIYLSRDELIPAQGSHCMRYNKICKEEALGRWSIASFVIKCTETAHLQHAVCAHMHLTQFVPFVHDIYSRSTAPHTDMCTTIRSPFLKEAEHSSSQHFHLIPSQAIRLLAHVLHHPLPTVAVLCLRMRQTAASFNGFGVGTDGRTDLRTHWRTG
jgi:hypothetical protein